MSLPKTQSKTAYQGNLLLEAEISNEYTGDEARRDLNLAGCALRTLPRLAQALEHNADYAKYEHSKRCTKGSV